MRKGSPHYSQDRDDYKTYERKRRKKHGRDKSDENSDGEVNCPAEEVIEIHGSSSEEEPAQEHEVRRRHKHSHKHRKHRKHDSKHKEHRSGHANERQSEESPDDPNDFEEYNDRKRQKATKKSKEEDPVLLENVKSSRHRNGSHDGDRNRERIKIKEERHSRERSRHREESRVRSKHDERSSRGSSRLNHASASVKEEVPLISSGIRVKEERMSRERSRLKEEPRESSRVKEERRASLARVKNEDNAHRRDRGPGERNDDRPRHGRNRGARRNDQDNTEYAWGEGSSNTGSGTGAPPAAGTQGEKDKPDFKLSGKLTEDTNTYNGVVIKYSEPPEARMPKKRWRLYQFKGEEALPTLYIHRQSAYLIGRDRKVADLPIDHPSCSKQHAALQYRLITFERPNGSIGKQIRLYVIDLESANGTFINGEKIDAKKYVELLEKDVIKFGFSSREYVLLHEQSKDDQLSDDE